MDGGNCSTTTGAGCGTVNSQFGAGPWEFVNIVANADGTVSIASVHFPNVFLRINGPGGIVNCQWTAGPWEKFTLVTNSDGTVSLATTAFSQVYYLKLDPSTVTKFNPAGWNTVSCGTTLDSTAKFSIIPAKQGMAVSNLALTFDRAWKTNNRLFGHISMTITNNTGTAFPASGSFTWVSLDVYASLQSSVNANMKKIGEVPANLGQLAAGASFAFKVPESNENDFTKRVMEKGYLPSGNYYIYVQSRDPDNPNPIDGRGAFSSTSFQLPPTDS
ncbi:MAG: hypothetical protein JO301_08450 [Chitinophagaceae bacterium]|nr:hypothetical protein [Chitinophagaceae bacterium]